MKRPIAVVQTVPTFEIYWTLTDFCNFKCNYCNPILHSGDFHQNRKVGFPTQQEIETFLDNIGKKYLKGRQLVVRLSGGEPTLHPMIVDIVARLKEYNGWLGITTNGSKPEDFWKQILPLDEVTISIHPEFTNIDRINRISKVILNSGSRLGYNLSCDPNNWDNVIALYNSLDDELKQYVNPKVLNRINVKDENYKLNYDYEPYQKEWINEIIQKKINWEKDPINSSFLLFSDGSKISARSVGRITLNNWHAMKGWSCNVGIDSVSVSFSGDAYAGICHSQKLGRIDSFELLQEPIVCKISRCICPGDLRVSKRIS